MTYTDAELLDYLKTAKSGITVMELAYSFGGTSSSHTARLRKLVKAGKIKTRKVGKTTRYYRANPRRRKKESKRAFVERVWSERAPRLPSHSYGPRRGLEGPFQFRSGKVLYYDPREGAYYDPDSDMYLSDSEAEAFIMNPRRKNSSVRYRVMYASVDGAGYYKKEGEPRTWATKEAAIRFADSKQENSDKSGNPYGYYYSVHTDTYPSRVVYRTR